MTITSLVVAVAPLGATVGVLSERLLGPPPLPTLLGEAMRVVTVLALVVMVWCSAYIIDRHRERTPRPILLLVWTWWAVGAALLAQVAANALTVPPTPGIYPAAFVSLAAAVAAARVAVRC